ncbi:hypothetical protein E3U55_13515 [Filobacillus milosensis]|uniref:phospholipase D n=1 Tax=Filobacillus milosensis TaxID=94137 RepID=A0A4Y8IL80_9BACI|nr:phospholipase D family protein [Filobacillus milosensis]TFB14639.1 hypothetical protein E3U55_13515 [Filobacillus milosensis]
MKKRKIFKKKKLWITIFTFLIIYLGTIAYHQFKPLPEGISYEGETHQLNSGDIEFLYDLTYQDNGREVYDQEIFDQVYKSIENAEEFLIMDFFMINEFASSNRDFPKISQKLSNKIIEQKEKHPDLKVVLITDPINTTYYSHEAQFIKPLEEAGVEVVYTKLERLRDPNPLYSAFYRMGIQWFGQRGDGWIKNPFGSKSPDVTARSYLKLFNIKANHRKILVNEDEGLVISANPHDGSGFHSNIGFKVKGDILKDIIESEKYVAKFSGGDLSAFPTKEELNQIESVESGGEIQAKIITEQKIQHAVVDAIDQAKAGDQVWIGMFFLSDRDIIDAIQRAGKRDVDVKLVLDPNQNAFGSEKAGLPNIPIASELLTEENMDIDMKWYNVSKEQYHSKIVYVRKEDSSTIIGGSGNYTSRNINNYNLESDIEIKAPNDQDIVQEVDDYFHRIWENDDGLYTVKYEEYAGSLTLAKRVLYTVQKLTMFTTY